MELFIKAGSLKFRKGEHVRICVNPDQFKKMQTEQFGGWNDDMAQVSGLLTLMFSSCMESWWSS